MLYLNHKENYVKVLGPGTRYVLWVQGCKKRCPGCIFPEGQVIGKNGYWVNVDDLAKEIKYTKGLTGITISGGEPFLQSKGIAKLLKIIRKETLLDVMIYSGYTFEELKQWNNVNVNYILNNCDILIDGEYVENLNNNKMYRGSDNQTIHFLSDKYKSFERIINNRQNRSIEFVYNDGELFVVGLPEKDFNVKFWRTVEELKIKKEKNHEWKKKL